MTVPGRRSSTFTRLLRHGFTAPAAAERLLEADELAPVRTDPVLLDALGVTAGGNTTTSTVPTTGCTLPTKGALKTPTQ